MSVQQAQANLSHLKFKLALADASAIALQTERQRLSFDAATGDAAAREALDRANAATVTGDLEIQNLRSAVEEGKRRLAVAEYDRNHAMRVRCGLSPLARPLSARA
jgi:hypothetical protein